MDEKQVKEICKFIIDNGSRKLTDLEKELLKQAIDMSNTWQELALVALTYSRTGNI